MQITLKYWQKLLFVSISLLAASAQARQPLTMNEDKTSYKKESIWPVMVIN